jgi:hypothetical protein
MRLNATFLKVGVFVAFAVQTAFGLYAQQPLAAALEPEPGLVSRGSAESDTNAPPAEKEDEPPHKRVRDIVKVGSDVVLKEGDASKDVVVVRGSATIDGTIEGDLVVVAGSATVNGKIKGNMVVVLGSAKLGPKAEIKRDATVVGGTLDTDPDAKIDGERVEVGGTNVPGLNLVTDWLKGGLFLARPLPPRLGWVWGVAAMLFLLNVLLSLMFPRPTQACTDQMDKSPVGSFFTGFLALILFGPLLILLAVTGIGVLIIPFLFCAMIVAFLFGKVAVYRYAGQQLVRPMNSAVTQSALVTLLAGTVIFYLLYTVPVVGFVVWGVAGLWGLGAVLMAAVRSFRREREEANPVSSVASGEATMTMGAAEQGGIPLALGLETSLPRVGFWLRFIATALDLILVGTISAWMHLPKLFFILWGIYHIAMWTWRGTTIGGIVMGIRVVRTDGRPLNFALALIRALSSLFSAMVLFLGFFWAGWSRERQSWHDKIAGTIVVKVPKGMSLV